MRAELSSEIICHEGAFVMIASAQDFSHCSSFHSKLAIAPPATAITKMVAATVPATFQLLVRAMVNNDGRFTAGPAISRGTTAARGAPAEIKINARGISKNVGSASGTAMIAITTILAIVPQPERKMPRGNNRAISIEIKTPITIRGRVRTATLKHERKKAIGIDITWLFSSVSVGQSALS